MTSFGVKAALAKVKVVALLAFEPGPGDGIDPAAVACHPGVAGGHRLHFIDKPRPISLHWKVHSQVTPIWTHTCHNANAGMVHTSPLVLGRADAGLDPDPISNLDMFGSSIGLTIGTCHWTAEQLDMNVTDPVGASFSLPIHLDVEIMQFISIKLKVKSLIKSHFPDESITLNFQLAFCYFENITKA